MNGQGLSRWLAWMVVTLTIATISCRKPSEAVKSDLKQAGYQLTTDDWFRASRSNEVSIMKKFATSGFRLDSRDAAGSTALHSAATAGAREAADFLLDRGLAVDVKDATDRTPLMCAVLAGQTHMVAWLLRQKASPDAKDKDGFTPLMLAVREGKPGAVAELAPYSLNDLDAAILMAALEGETQVIDTLTNYGASVYARMEDGRTPLMIAAQNGHADAVKLLLDIGANRMTTDSEGHTAADLALDAGHPEIAALLTREPLPGEIALDTPDEVAKTMDAYMQSATTPRGMDSSGDGSGASPPSHTGPSPATPIDGATVSRISDDSNFQTAGGSTSQADPVRNSAGLPPLVMRHYSERILPIQVTSVESDVATFRIVGSKPHEIHVRAGETIPNTKLVVVRMHRRMEDSKVNLGQPVEISTVEVKDSSTGATREWIAGIPSSAHDPVALLEDSATGQRYTAVPGQRFKSQDGGEFLISEVRPNQIVIKNESTSAVSTLPLRGPRG